MLVYGDPWRLIDVAAWRDRAGAPLPTDGLWIERHAELAARLIEGGQILQALQDEAFDAHGAQDRPTDARWTSLQRSLTDLARAFVASFDHADPAPLLPDPPGIPGDARILRAREPEGYAFYALYPEAYALAARRMAPDPRTLTIGLRSIGASLAPVVAAVCGARDFVTLRPKGDAFQREIAAPDLAAALASGPARPVAIVDEGPGLSGSSFAGAARFVRAHRFDSRLRLLPSHAGGPGARADADARALFDATPTFVAPFDAVLTAQAPRWVSDLTGPPLAPLEDLSGGAWRSHLYPAEADWPAVDPGQERRKFLLRAERGDFVLKFIGLGQIGARKARLAAQLGDAGFAPACVGYRHGFMVERWRGDARPLHLHADRAALLSTLGRYIGFRRRRWPCPDAYGACASELCRMVERNVGLALGSASVENAQRRTAPLLSAGTRLQKIATDNRMQAHEWLVTPAGAVLKTDGADHHAGHDLIGAQDCVYDIAAAAVECGLTRAETAALCDEIANDSGQSVAADLIAPMRIVWLAFELGRITFAENACGAGDEAQRLRARRHALAARLEAELRS